MSIRVSLNKGIIILNPNQFLSHALDEKSVIHKDGFIEHRVRIGRENLISGIFYAVEGMKVGGYRKVTISSHLAYKEKGIPVVIPENAKLNVEIHVISEANDC